jgi:hypothetical protein
VKYILSRVAISAYEIDFTYTTKKGNSKTQQVTVQQTDEDLAKRDFWIWYDTMKESEPDHIMKDAVINKVTKKYTKYMKLDKKV